MAQLGIVYLVHFDRPLAHAQHYIGWTRDVEVRVERHRNGRGSRLLAAVQDEEISWEVVRRWRGTRTHERALKKQRHNARFCPRCTAKPRNPKCGVEEISTESAPPSVKEYETPRF